MFRHNSNERADAFVTKWRQEAKLSLGLPTVLPHSRL